MFEDIYLRDIKDLGKVLRGNCNSGTATPDKTVRYNEISMWFKKRGIANLLSIPQLEWDGYHVTYDTLKEWVVHAADGTEIVFKRDTELCDRMSYIDMRKIKSGFSMLHTVRNKFEGFTNIYF